MISRRFHWTVGILAGCLLVGAVVGILGFLLTAASVAISGDDGGTLQTVAGVMLIGGAAAGGIGAIGLLVIALRILARHRREADG